MSSKTVRRVTLVDCAVVHIRRASRTSRVVQKDVAQEFDTENPNGNYELELSDPGQRLVAQLLFDMYLAQGGTVWKKPKFNKKPLNEDALKAWQSKCVRARAVA